MKIRKTKIALFFLIVLITGCAESNFDLAKESRLPKWFSVPQGMARDDLRVTVAYYIVPTEKAVFTLFDKDGNKITVKTGKRYGGYLYPKKLKNPPPGFPEGYPSYEIIVADGVIDIIEHRKMEPIFYMTDNPAVWAEFGVKQ